MTNLVNHREVLKTTGASGSQPLKLKATITISMITMSMIAILMIAASAQICRAQDAPPPAGTDKNSADQKRAQKPVDSSTQPSGHGRMFGIMPSYGIVAVGMHPPPLTSGQKFKLAVQYINPYTFVFVAAEAGINQARNSPSDFGQGAEGYGKRYGAGLADGLTDGLFTTGLYPSLLHQDPRYYRLGDGGFVHRTWYAVSRILVTRQDSGRAAFNASEVLGSFSSSALGVTYYPKSQRDFSDVAERAGVQFAFDAGFRFLKEFYPDIQRKLSRKHNQ